jgi:hypothetical protein
LKLGRLWQPARLLFWQMVFFNVMSSVCAWALRALPLNGVGIALVAFIALLNCGFGLMAAWMLLRDEPPAQRPGGGAGGSSASTASTSE